MLLRKCSWAGALALVVLALGCSEARTTTGKGEDESVPEEQRYGGTAVVAEGADLDDLNPLTSTNANSNYIISDLLFMPLLRRNEQLVEEPYLAKAWEVNDDSTHLTFHLRDDVAWHDNTRVTAYDLKFSYDRARDPQTAFPNGNEFASYGEGVAVDSFTFRVEFTPHAEFLSPWVAFAPVPRHILEGVPPSELRKHTFGTARPIGNGPFRFVARAQGQQWVFEANDRFPADLGGRPYLDRIVYRVIPEATTQLTELLTGDVDYLPRINPDQRGQLHASGNARVVAYKPPNSRYIVWNTRRPLFEDVRVRRALTMAIDRQEIIDGILLGNADLANSAVPPAHWPYDREAGADLRHSPEAARRLLTEAGWQDRDGNGTIEDPDGREFRFTLLTTRGNDVRADIVEKVASDLREVGIVAEPRLMEFTTLVARLGDKARDFDAVLTGVALGLAPRSPSDGFHCRNRDQVWQQSGICDSELDRLLDTIPLVVDRAAAQPLWSDLQYRMATLQPSSFLYHEHMLAGVASRLQNVRPDARSPYVGARHWWILPQARRTGGAQGPPN